MYSRKENTMANKHDSFNMDKYKSKEKKEKPIKEKKEKESSFDMGGGFSFKSRSDSFNTDKFKAKEKKEKPMKEIKEKESSFDMGDKPERKSLFNLGKQEGSLDVENSGVNKNKMIMRLGIAGGALLVLIALAIIIPLLIIPVVDNYGMEISSIEVSRLPEKTVYMIGEEADYTGLRVTVTRNNGEKFIVRADECQFFGFDSQYASDNQTITVIYEKTATTFNVIIQGIETPKPVLKSIRLDPLPTKLEYKVGEWLDTEGGEIVCEYMDGTYSRIDLINDYVYGWDKVWGHGPGEYVLTVKFIERGVLVTTTYTITVTE